MELFGEAWTDAEVFKVILNNGFMALFVTWVLFKGEPRYREMIDRMETKHESTIAGIMDTHEKVLAALHRECREERKEIMAAIVREGELNRESRHEAHNSMVAAIAEVYRGSERERQRNDRADRAEAKKSQPPGGPRPGSHERTSLPPPE
jgi:hypothetical protein